MPPTLRKRKQKADSDDDEDWTPRRRKCECAKLRKQVKSLEYEKRCLEVRVRALEEQVESYEAEWKEVQETCHDIELFAERALAYLNGKVDLEVVKDELNDIISLARQWS
jgi:predicted RNase H-like nuclease (RuvC/YqgF family)